MAFDIKAKVEEIAKKVSSDKALQEQFTKDPIKAVESLIGVDLPDDMIKQVVNGVKAKITTDKAAGALDSLKGLLK